MMGLIPYQFIWRSVLLAQTLFFFSLKKQHFPQAETSLFQQAMTRSPTRREFTPSPSLLASPVWSQGFTSHLINHISSKPQWLLKQVQCQPDFPTAFSPVSSRGSIPSWGSSAPSPRAQGLLALPLHKDGQLPCQLARVLILLPNANTCIWDRNQAACHTSLSSQVPSS